MCSLDLFLCFCACPFNRRPGQYAVDTKVLRERNLFSRTVAAGLTQDCFWSSSCFLLKICISFNHRALLSFGGSWKKVDLSETCTAFLKLMTCNAVKHLQWNRFHVKLSWHSVKKLWLSVNYNSGLVICTTSVSSNGETDIFLLSSVVVIVYWQFTIEMWIFKSFKPQAITQNVWKYVHKLWTIMGKLNSKAQ